MGFLLVLFVGDGLKPAGAAIAVRGGVDGEVDHEGVGGRTVPVFFARGEVHHVAGIYLRDGAAFCCGAAGPCENVQDLAFGMGVPVGAGAGLEGDAEDTSVGGRSRRRGLHPDGAGETRVASGKVVYR